MLPKWFFIYFNSEIVAWGGQIGKQVETSNELWLEVMETKCSASTAVLCSSFFPLYFCLKTYWDCAWNPAVTMLTHPLKFSSDRVRRLQQLNKKAGARALVRRPSPLPGTQPAQSNRERQMASDRFLFNFCKLCFSEGSSFALRTVFVILPCVFSFTCYTFSFFFIFLFWFWGEGTRAALAIPEADVPWIHTVAKSYFSLLRILSFCFSFFFDCYWAMRWYIHRTSY